MDFLLNRYRNLTVLLVVIVVQLLLLAYQVKTNKDVPLMRVWAVSTVTPVEQALEFVRRHTFGFAGDYFDLVHVREENDKLQRDLDRLKLENHYLKSELSMADRVKQLDAFRQDTPSKTLVARAIGNGTGANSKTIFVDRGTTAGVENGMAVITPDGIVGKVVSAYPTASLVMLMTDPTFAAGVLSQKNHVHGTLKGLGGPKCRVDYVQNEEKVDVGEWLYTSGDDGIFPRGFPAGQVASVVNGRTAKEIIVTPSGWQGGLDEVLIVIEGIHQAIPNRPVASAPIKILAPPPDESNTGVSQNTAALATDADKLRQEYKQVGEQEKIQFGASGTKPPDFSKVGKPAEPPAAPAKSTTTPASQVGTPTAGQPVRPPSTPATGATAPPKTPAVADVRTTPSTAAPAMKPPASQTGTAVAGQFVRPSNPATGTPKPPGADVRTGPAIANAPVKPPTLQTGTSAAGQPGRPPSIPAISTATSTGLVVKSTPSTQPNTTTRPANKTVEHSAVAAAPDSKPKPRPPVLETDPTDADPANEAVAERIQRERSNAKVVSEDKNTEILVPATPPKPKSSPKTVPAKIPTQTTGATRTGASTP